MLQKIVVNFKKKSLKERFLLVIGMFFFLMYLVLGLIIIFWKNMPITMQPKYRIAFGILLIVYAYIRFTRFFAAQKEEL
jgi:uncharacterized membrane protein (DUF485 family)